MKTVFGGEFTVKVAANPNNKFNANVNSRGFSGSYRHDGGTQLRIPKMRRRIIASEDDDDFEVLVLEFSEPIFSFSSPFGPRIIVLLLSAFSAGALL
jgi:hypothetical protein